MLSTSLLKYMFTFIWLLGHVPVCVSGCTGATVSVQG